jgi:hypothetical protein
MFMMVKRLGCVLVLACAGLAASAQSASAQQTLNLSWGYSMMRTGRVPTDILLIEHNDLEFKFSDFNAPVIGVEWLVPFGNLLEAGLGASFSRDTVPTVHVGVVNSDRSPIPRDLGLRQIPMALTVRVLPLGQSYSVQPYVGGGFVLINWRFTESGDFAAATRRTIFRGEQYSATGNARGVVLLSGLRAVTGDTFAFGIEARYQRARGHFGPIFARQVNPDLDLGGLSLLVTAGMRFGK